MKAEGMAVVIVMVTVANIAVELEVILEGEERRVEVMLIRTGEN